MNSTSATHPTAQRLSRRALLGAPALLAAAPTRRNVLLICVDDLRPWLGSYGASWMRTPHWDRLAAQGRRFQHHYVQSAVCGPSRCALLTGNVWDTWDCWESDRRRSAEPAQPVSIAHALKRRSYQTVSIGKVSHQPAGTMDNEQRIHQVPFSWSKAYTPVGQWRTPWRSFFGFANGEAYNRASLPPAERDAPRFPWEAADLPDGGYPDGLIAAAASNEIASLAQASKPFFLAVGFNKPHLPFACPKRYWDLYPEGSIPDPPNNAHPSGVDPRISLHPSSELLRNYAWPNGATSIDAKQARTLRHAYAACASYSDAQVGKVLAALTRHGLDKDTLVIAWSDHGWHLGEHNVFGKHTNHEVATRSPLIIRDPQQKAPGAPTNSFVETVDIYATVAEYCGVKPSSPIRGRSLWPILRNPNAAGRDAAFSFFNRSGNIGRTIRTASHRLVVWTNPQGGTIQTELYDHRSDPGETANLAPSHPSLCASLLQRLPPLSAIQHPS